MTAPNSLTRDNFEHREAVVRTVSGRDSMTAAELVGLSQDQASPLCLRARYVLRRSARSLATRLLPEAESAQGAARTEAERTLLTLLDHCSLDVHHHGGWQKRAILFEQLGRSDRALDAYQRWNPPNSGCGTCNAGIRAEKTAGLLRCLVKLKRLAEVEALCWSEIEKDESNGKADIALTLVDMYEERGSLAQLERKLKGSPSANRPPERCIPFMIEEAATYSDSLRHYTAQEFAGSAIAADCSNGSGFRHIRVRERKA